MLEQFQRFDEFVAGKRELAAETIGIRALLDFCAFEGRRADSRAGDDFALMDARANAGSVPAIDFAELHTSFGERNSLHRAHSGVGFEQQIKRDSSGISN